MSDPIIFQATVAKAQTLADGGLRFTFDTSEGELMALAQLAACKQAGAVLRVTCEVEGQKGDGKQPDHRKIHI